MKRINTQMNREGNREINKETKRRSTAKRKTFAAAAIMTTLCMTSTSASSVFASETGKKTVKEEQTTEAASEESRSDEQAIMMENGQVISAEDGEISSDLISGTFKPSDVTMQVQDVYEFPFLGMNLTLPKELLKQMDKKTIAMLGEEEWNDDATKWTYAYISWSTMTKEQRDAEVNKLGTGYEDWVASLDKIGMIGAYDEESAKKLDEITGCTEHTKLGESSNGAYTYYLSINKDADEKLVKELEEIKTEFTDMAEFQQITVFDKPQEGVSRESVTSLGTFETTGIDGKTYTEDVFSDYDLTLVNIFTTWCSPCVKEIPELEKLYQEYKDKGVGIVGVVLDTVGEDGSVDEDSVSAAKELQEKTGATYPFLIPDEGKLNGRLNGINAFPETFFVDKNGNIVGEVYTGSHDLDEWKEIVGDTLASLSEEESTTEEVSSSEEN